MLYIIPIQSHADTNNAGFINITYLNGLTTNTIYDLETDPSGSIWIGTATGLSKYDGYYVKNYFKEEMNIRSNTIKYLHRDRQNRLWIGTSNGVGLYDIDSDKFLTLDMLSGEILEKKTAGIFEDSQGTIWIPFRKGGLISIDPNTFSTKNYFSDIVGNDYFARIWFEPENNLYLAAKYNGGLFYLEPENGNILPFCPVGSPESQPFEKKCIRGLIKVNKTDFCISCTDGTLWIVNPYDKTFEELPIEGVNARSLELRRVFIIGDNKLGVTHNKGFFVYDLQTRSVESNEFADNFTDKNIYCIRGSLENGLIVGSFNDGVTIQQERPFRFSLVRDDQKNKKISLKESNVSGFAQIDESKVFISTKFKGLFIYDINKKKLKKWSSPFIPKNLEGVVSHEGHIWTWSASGIYSLNPQTSAVRSYLEGCGEPSSLIATQDGRLVMLSDERLLQFDPVGDCFTEIKAFKEMSVLSIGRSESSSLVAITREKGLVRWHGKRIYDIEDKNIKYEKSHNWTGLLFEDNSSHVWTALPESGVFISSDKDFSSITTRSGLSSDIITNIIKDNSSNVFITTDRSLSMISPEGKMFSLTKSDGLLNFGFSRNAAFKTSTGEILLGSRDGFTIIKNSKNEAHHEGTRIKAVEKIICNGEEIQINDKGQVKLRHHQNSFHISVMDINPHTVATGKSLFCMEGHDHTWIPAGNDRKLSYLNLKPGKYVFKAYNSLIEPVEIKVCAHPLLSITAYIIYFLGVLILMFFIILYIRDHEIRKRKEKMMQMKLDLHQEKLDFFTNIAHEIKTPLTLITTPLNHLKSNQTIDEEAMYDIHVMDKHASYLSTLVRELLEFSKIERGTYNVTCSPIDLTALASNIITNFKEQNQGLKWDVSMPKEALWVMADTSATMKVLNNLVFNAIKYTDSYIEIELAAAEDGKVTLSIANDGDIIPQEMRERIFRTFVQYQSDHNESKEGFGIGLSVAKTLAELQNGSLCMSEDNDVNKFIFTLPATAAPGEAKAEEANAHEAVADTAEDEGRSTVLVVEDHPELLDTIMTATNGAEAFEVIKSKSNIDLVVTDLKMPQMSGMELCKKIKQDPTFSHILLVILSANLTSEIKIESLKNGADAIIEKPFSMEFLESRIENLISSRKKLIEMISSDHDYQEPEEEESTDGLSARDIVFLRELNICVEKNFSDPDFGVEELATQLNISRSSLNRKMRDILNTTANNYIRDKKIEKAEELLRTSTMQINEICYKVGFTTPSYFIKCFRKKYDMSPNEYANSNH